MHWNLMNDKEFGSLELLGGGGGGGGGGRNNSAILQKRLSPRN